MRASMDTYKNVGENCSAYAPKNDTNTFTNKSNYEGDVSCTTCSHFTNEKYCDIDLYDKIVENHAFNEKTF